MIRAMIHDWSPGNERPDLLKFVPFHVNIDMKLNGYEVITYVNQYNWIDCSKTGLENEYMVFDGSQLRLSFGLDFLEFLGPLTEIPFSLTTPHVDVKMYFPDSHAQNYTIASLYRSANVETFSGKKIPGIAEMARPFRDSMGPGSLWCHTWSVVNFQMSLNYCYHNETATAPGELPR